jgi:hypothetical protein
METWCTVFEVTTEALNTVYMRDGHTRVSCSITADSTIRHFSAWRHSINHSTIFWKPHEWALSVSGPYLPCGGGVGGHTGASCCENWFGGKTVARNPTPASTQRKGHTKKVYGTQNKERKGETPCKISFAIGGYKIWQAKVSSPATHLCKRMGGEDV